MLSRSWPTQVISAFCNTTNGFPGAATRATCQVHAFKRSTYDTQMDMKARDEAVLKKISSYPPGKLAKDRKFTYQKVCRSSRFKNKKMCLAPGVCMFFHSAKKGVPPPAECPKPPDSLLTQKAKGLMSMATSWWSKGKAKGPMAAPAGAVPAGPPPLKTKKPS